MTMRTHVPKSFSIDTETGIDRIFDFLLLNALNKHQYR
jgi:hypothetical protein